MWSYYSNVLFIVTLISSHISDFFFSDIETGASNLTNTQQRYRNVMKKSNRSWYIYDRSNVEIKFSIYLSNKRKWDRTRNLLCLKIFIHEWLLLVCSGRDDLTWNVALKDIKWKIFIFFILINALYYCQLKKKIVNMLLVVQSCNFLFWSSIKWVLVDLKL